MDIYHLTATTSLTDLTSNAVCAPTEIHQSGHVTDNRRDAKNETTKITCWISGIFQLDCLPRSKLHVILVFIRRLRPSSATVTAINVNQ